MATDTWMGGSSDENWDTASNWSAGVPGASDTAVIPTGTPTCNINDATDPVTVGAIYVEGGLQVDSPPDASVHTYLTVNHGVQVGSATNKNGNFVIDNDANHATTEGSTVVIKGTLTNYNDVSMGSPGGPTYTTDVTVGAINNTNGYGFNVISGFGDGPTTLHVNSAAGFGTAGTISGTFVTVQGSDAQINFKSGYLTTIAAGSSFKLDGAGALVTSGGRTTYNSALTKLSQIDGSFTLADAATVSITGDVDVPGAINVFHGGRLNVSGSVTNDSSSNGTITVAQDGGFGSSGGGKTILSVGSFINKATTAFPARLGVYGGSTAADESILYDKSVAGFGQTGVVDGVVSVSGYGLIQFASGSITEIDSNSGLELDGPNAFVADAGHTGSNSALTKLNEVDGEFSLSDGAMDSITGDVHVLGRIDVASGSRLTISGKLSNDSSSNGVVAVTSDGEQTILSVGSFENVPTSGYPARLSVTGGSTATDQAIMDVSSAAGFGQTGIVDGSVVVSGNAFIDFTSGQIMQIASDGNLTLDGDDAFLASGSATTSNSALTGLTTVAGTLQLEDGASLSTGALTDSGQINVYAQGDGGSGLTVKGALTITGGIRVDGDTGSGNLGRLYVSGATGGTNGTISLGSDSRVSLIGTVYHDLTLNYNGTNAVAALGNGPKSSFNVTGFASGDTLDLKGETVTQLSYANSTLTLTLSTGQTQNIAFTGSFSGLSHTGDGHGGTYITATTPAEAAAEPDVFAHYASLAQTAAFAGGSGSDGASHPGYAEMMAHAIDGGSGAMSGSLHAPAGAPHAPELFASALHGH